jgi:mRNA interferase MazF
MTSFRAGDIVAVDYPHVESGRRTRRPAVVVSHVPLGPGGLVVWAMMITSATNRGWPGDLVIEAHAAAGLPIPSVIRTEKMATIEAAGAERIGKIGDMLLEEVRKAVIRTMGLSARS